jgi:predicted dehydrogenase
VSDQIRAGIIGVGFMGRVHGHAIRAAGGTVAAVAASSPDRARQAALGLHAEDVADSAEQLIGRVDVDVVHICTPNHLHALLAESALTGGKHVVCEKPIATDLGEARRLAAQPKV